MLGCVGWILLNLIPPKNLPSDEDNESVVTWNRYMMFTSFVILFISVVFGTSIMLMNLSGIQENRGSQWWWVRWTAPKFDRWIFIATCLSPIGVSLSALMFFFTRLITTVTATRDEEWGL
jgi:uncharacterized membrane protein